MIDAGDFDALTFDCYGTLVDWEGGILVALRPWALRAGLAAEGDELLAVFAEAEPACEAAAPKALYRDILRDVHTELARRLGAQPDAGAAEFFAQSVGDWPVFADTPGAMRRLKSRFKLCVVSNVDRASFARTAVKLGVELDALVTAEDVGAYKPDHAMFRAAFEALAALDVEQDRILHVAQSLYHDHVPANALGMRTCWIDRRGDREGNSGGNRGGNRGGGGATPAPAGSIEPDFVFASLAELADALGV